MKIYRFDFTNTPIIHEPTVLCLGFFDGLHLGHKELINEAKKHALNVGLLTFSSSFKKNDKCLTTLEDKISLLEKEGIDSLYIVENTIELSSLTADDFIQFVLKKINPQIIVCGSDFKFGHFGKGNAELLKNYFTTIVVDLLEIDGEKISSTNIKKCIENGDLVKANFLLDRPFKIVSYIVKGLGNGSRVLSYPTFNIPLEGYVVPAFGVYFVNLYIDNKKYDCIANVGVHPSIDELDKPLIEVYLQEQIEINSVGVGVEFLHFHRKEIKFDNVNLLKEQIKNDVSDMENFFKN